MSMCMGNNSPGKAVCQLMRRLQKYINVYIYTFIPYSKITYETSLGFAGRLTRRYRQIALSHDQWSTQNKQVLGRLYK